MIPKLQFVFRAHAVNMGIVLVTTLLGIVAFLTFKLLREFWKLHSVNVPVPNEYPIFLEIFVPILKLGMLPPSERFEKLSEMAFKFPNLLKGWLGSRIVILVNNPDGIQKVLMSQKCLEKWNLFYGLMERDAGLISASARKKWKEHRKFFNFSFSLKILESFTQVFIEHSKALCENLDKEAENGKEFDFSVYSKRISFDVLCATSLGTNTNDLKNDKIYEDIFDAYET